MVHYFHPIAFVRHFKLINEGYKDVSLADKIVFYGYNDSDSVGCFRRCKDMVGSVGYKSVAVTDKSVIQMTKYKSVEEEILVVQKDVKKGIQLIHDFLDDEKPIIIGIEHKLGHTGNYDKTTDHWLVIVGRKTDDKGVHFLFFDPQTGHKDIGTSQKNKLTIQDDFTLKGKYRNKPYTVTMVRPVVK